MSKTPLYLLMLFLLCFVVVAAPPSRTVSSNAAHTLSIERSTVDYFKQNTAFDFYIHVFNSTGHWLNNQSCNCLLHIYNSTTGSHIYNKKMIFSNDWDFEAELNSSMTSQKGFYPYVVQCNTSYEGGYYQGYYEVNDHSRELTNSDTTPGISLVIFILFSTALMFALPTMLGKISENQIINIMLHRCFIIIGFYLMVMNSGIISSIAVNAGYSTGEIFRYLWIFGQAGYLLMFGTFIKTFFDLIMLWQKLAKEKRGL